MRHSLDAEDESAVGSEVQLLVLHGVVQVDQVAHVHRRLVVKVLGGRVQVHHVHRPLGRLRVLLHRRAVRALAGRQAVGSDSQ